MPSPSTALQTTGDEHPALALFDQRASALLDLLPDSRAVDRFRRIVLQAVTKDPKLAKATPASIFNAVIDAAMWGLEPSGRVGGAYLVPFNVNVGTQSSPRYEVQAQMIPDYRGLIGAVTRQPSQVTAIAATLVHEGDEFTDFREGVDGYVHHRPSLAADRSTRPTTHAYAIASLATGERIVRVVDRSYAEKLRGRSKSTSSPWHTDFDAMFRKTAIKAIGNNLPVSPEVRALFARDDDYERSDQQPRQLAAPDGPSKTARLGQRLRREREPSVPSTPDPRDASRPTGDDVVEGEAHEVDQPAAATRPAVDAHCGWRLGQGSGRAALGCGQPPNHPGDHDWQPIALATGGRVLRPGQEA